MHDSITYPHRVTTAKFRITVYDHQMVSLDSIIKRFGATNWLPSFDADANNTSFYGLYVWMDEQKDWRGFEVACDDAGIDIKINDTPGDMITERPPYGGIGDSAGMAM